MPLNIYGLKNCDKCRAALRALEAAGHEVTLIDVRPGLPPQTIRRFLTALGAPLVNRRSTTWRGLSEEARAGDPATLLAEHPTLMKRPVIEINGALHLGWTPEIQAALLAK